MTNQKEWIQYLSGGICILSILGSLAIILTYVLVKDIRSKARELLVHISLMDVMYSTANLVGLALPYSEHLEGAKNGSQYETYLYVCKTQAFLASYGTIGSVLWTLGLAVYLYYRVVSRDPNVTKWVVRVLYVVCYTLPLYVSLWLLLDNWMGYPKNRLAGAGWCSVKDNVNTVVSIMTYDVWMWLGFVILVPLYLVVNIHIREQLKPHESYILFLTNHPTVTFPAEQKLLLVPLVFIFLRVWDIVDDVLTVYYDTDIGDRDKFLWLQMLTIIGDCSQGFFNFIIFFLFQQRLRTLMCGICRCYCCRYKRPTPQTISSGYYNGGLINDESLKEPYNKSFSQTSSSDTSGVLSFFTRSYKNL